MALQKKPLVVTIVGHVDHGKTTLLDYIRKTKIAEKEFGQITQSIGAYQIDLKGQKITFVDTPGHEAFTAMRARGTKVADLVVLVVSGNDGVMKQTKECISLLLEGKTPFLVAITKVDLPESSIERVKAQLAESQVFVEGFGGNVVTVPVSAKTGQGIDQLLEMILLVAEMEDLKADPQGELQAVVVETKADKNCGCLSSLIIQNGTLRVGDKISDGKISAKVKLIQDDRGKTIKEAGPGQPVVILGFSQLPAVGSIIVRTEEENKTTPDFRKAAVTPSLSVDGEKKQKIILKADVFGSLEAITSCLPEQVLVIDKSVGGINESDVLLAKTFGAEIYGFNLGISSSVDKLAKTEKVKIKVFKIIYDLLQALEKEILETSNQQTKKKILGRAEILKTFDIKGQKIAGCRVVEGKINRKYPISIVRGENEIAEARIVSLKQEKQDINEAVVSGEFGAVFEKKVDFEIGDMLLSYSPEEN